MSDKPQHNADSCAQQRTRVQQIARKDWSAALKAAAVIELPWYRAQSLATVARHAPENNVADVLRRAIRTADGDTDEYRRTAVLSWVIDAALARGERAIADRTLKKAVRQAAEIQPLKSRGQALELLLGPALTLGPTAAEAVVDATIVTATQIARTPWRNWAKSLLNRAVRIVGDANPALAEHLKAARAELGPQRSDE